jgi:methylated-DNA-protein-cysteine methyltransferase-like protein
MTGSSSYQRIYAAVRRIPRGRVSTYGAIARVAGLAGQARQVGYALSALPAGTTVPWHRVINAQGRLSLERSASGAGITQRLRLVREGVVVDAAGRVSLEKFGWRVRGGNHAGKRAGRSVPSRATH